jgi:hypothetical protein
MVEADHILFVNLVEVANFGPFSHLLFLSIFF